MDLSTSNQYLRRYDKLKPMFINIENIYFNETIYTMMNIFLKIVFSTNILFTEVHIAAFS